MCTCRMGSDAEVSECSSNGIKATEVCRFHCPYPGCSRAFTRQWKLDTHICSHTKERPFKCEVSGCNKDYTSKSHLKRHMSVSHRNVGSPVTCIPCPYSECPKMFQNIYSLKKHFKSHLAPNEYKCPDCDLTFKKRRLLTIHSFEHTGKLPYSCTECKESFITKTLLNNHKKKHRVYVCEYEDCKENFALWSLYRKHLKIKHPRCYTCHFCSRSYMNKNTLGRHVMTHLDDSVQDAYPCTFRNCLKFYRHKKNLVHHLKVAHEGKRYECTEENCNKVYKSKNRLLDHQTRHLNGTLNAPRKKSLKVRKGRKDKGLRKKCMASILSGMSLPRELDKCLAQNVVTSEVENQLNYIVRYGKAFIDSREVESDSSPSSEDERDNDPAKSILCVLDEARLRAKRS